MLGFVMTTVPFLVEREAIVRLFGSLVYYSFMFVGPAAVVDASNYLRGKRSFLHDMEEGKWEPLFTFSIGGVIAGSLWEGWNYQATGRWVYPLLPFQGYKAFELPLPFFLYYMPFTIGCMAIVELMTPERLNPFKKVWPRGGNP